MKVLYIIAAGKGGSSLSLIELIRKLITFGVEPLIIAQDKIQLEEFIRLGCKGTVVNYRYLMWPNTRCLIDYFYFIPRLTLHLLLYKIACHKVLKVAKSFKPDIIHTNVAVSTLGLFVSTRLSIPHIWHVREYIKEDFNMKPIPTYKSLILKLSNNNTISISKDLEQHMKLKNNRVIYNGIREFNEGLKCLIKDNYFLFVGRLSSGKGVDEVIRAFASFAKKNDVINLKIAGSSADLKYIKELKDFVYSHNIENRVEFLGQQKEIDTLISKAQAIIVASKSEGFGRITAEAMFNHCLVIGKDLAGTKEQFDNGLQFTGREIAIRYLSEEELINALMKVANKDVDLTEITELAYNTVNNLYSTISNAQNILNYYTDLLVYDKE